MGVRQASSVPLNYEEENVLNETLAIEDANVDGVCDVIKYNFISLSWKCTISPTEKGDNHLGYMGFRDRDNPSLLADDGAMNIVVRDWIADP